MRDSRKGRVMRGMLALAGAPLLPVALGAQGGTDIWVASFHEVGTQVSIGRPRNATQRAGYDNQPAFSPDGRTIYYTVIGTDARADIWRMPAAGGAPARQTETPESEYSATPTPDGRHLSVIRVERDSTQRLWKFPLDGSAPSLVLRALRPVGYHVWVGDHLVGTFVLTPPGTRGHVNALVLADTRTERADTLARDIGRALVRIPGRDAFSFIQLGGDTAWIAEVDVRTQRVSRVAPAPAGADYHLWTPGGQLITAAGTQLLIRTGGRWDLLADFAELGVRGITRLTLSPTGDRIAFVAEDRPAP